MKINEKRAILLTGATGFLGSNILRSLVDKGYVLAALKRSNSDMTRLKEIKKYVRFYDVENVDYGKMFVDNKIDTVIHCATNYGKTQKSSIDIVEANLILPLRLLEFGEKNGLRCFINTDTILNKRINDYTLSKNQFKQWFLQYSGKLVCVNVELEHFYGPNDNPTKFVTYIVRNLLNDISSFDLTKGDQKRYFIYINDVVTAFDKIVSRSKYLENGFYRFQIASEKPNTIKEFVLKAKKLTGNNVTRLNFGVIPYRKNEIMSPNININNLKELGWSQKYSLDDGLKIMIKHERRLLK